MSHRTIALVGAAALLLAGCGGSTQPQPRQTRTVTVTPTPGSASTAATTSAPPTTPAAAAPVTSSAAPAATAGGSTTTLVVAPSRTAGWTTTDAGASIQCTDSSSYATSAGTYTCGATAEDAYACVADSDPAHVLCVQDPWTRQATRFEVDGTLPQTSKPSAPTPLGIELDDGSRWKPRSGGAVPAASENSAVTYYCQRGCGQEDVLVGPADLGNGPLVDTSHPVWTVRRGRMGTGMASSRATTARIARAWFLQAPSGGGQGGGVGASSGAGGSTSGSSTGAFGAVRKVSIAIAQPGDVASLPDSYDLRSFARRELKKANTEAGCSYTLTVTKIDARSTAAVDVFAPDCGGSEEIWGVKDGHWVKAYDGQDVPSCAELRATGATLNPAMVSCQDGSSGQTHPYTP